MAWHEVLSLMGALVSVVVNFAQWLLRKREASKYRAALRTARAALGRVKLLASQCMKATPAERTKLIQGLYELSQQAEQGIDNVGKPGT